MKLFIIAALIAGSVTAAVAEPQPSEILTGKILHTDKFEYSTYILVLFKSGLYTCKWFAPRNEINCDRTEEK